MTALRDVLRFEELRTELQAIADDMAIRFARSSRSPVIREYLDFSTAICLPDGRIAAQGFSLPLHLGAVPRAVAAVLRRFPDGLRPGDLAILNDPYHGGMHLPDIFTVAPAYAFDELVGYVVVVAHHIDIGGRVAGGSAADSRSIFEEGLRLPPVLLQAQGVRNTELEHVLRVNVRIPDIFLSDLQAQAAGATMGGHALAELVGRHGLDGYRAAVERILDHGRRSLESELRTWPEGEYEFEDVEDHDGFGDNPVRIRVRVTVRDGRIGLDFTGSAAQVPGSINATLSFTESASYAAVRSLVAGEIPVNAGFLERIDVTAPAGSVLNASFPAGVAARGVLGYRVIEVVYGALAAALPDRVPAAGDGGTSGIRFGGVRDGRLFQANDLVCGAWGARPHGDGVDGAANMAANVSNRSAEQIERDDPLRVLAYGFVSDSGGVGRHRGGLAVRRVLEVTAEEAMLNLRTHRNVTPPYGLSGGQPGRVSRTWLIRDGERTLLPAKVTVLVRRGDVIEHHTASGGGWGDPALRSTVDLIADLADGKISVTTAREVYGLSDDQLAATGPTPGGGAMTGLDDALVEFVVDTPAAAVPARARVNAVDTIVDTVATTWAGITEPGAVVIRDAMLAVAAAGPARVAGHAGTVDAAAAALCNASAAHALDYDAINFAVSGFVGSATIAALSAVAEERNLDPHDVVTAYCLGWEVGAVLGRALNPEHYDRGWHPTATLALMSATMGLARLVGLDHDRTRAALSVAVSEASGIKIMIGNMLNAYHVGKAARNAVTAVRLAEAGFVGHAQPLDATQGFLALFAGASGPNTQRALAGVGTEWDLVNPGPVWKVHACCGLIHSGADAVAEIRAAQGLSTEDIERVDLELHAYVPKVMHVQHPTTGYAAKFCIPYCVAAAVRDGRAGLSAFDTVDPELVRIGERVTFAVHPQLTDGETFFEKEFTDVRLYTTRGVFEHRVHRLHNRGSGSIPETELRGKFRECVTREPAMTRDADAEFDRVRTIDSAAAWQLWAT